MNNTSWKIAYVLIKQGSFTCLRHEAYVARACEKLALLWPDILTLDRTDAELPDIPGAVRYTLRKIEDPGELVAELDESDEG